MTRTIDYTALLAPTTKAEIAAFKAESRAAGNSPIRSGAAKGAGVGCAIVLAGFFIVAMSIGFATALGPGFAESPAARTIAAVFPALLLVFLVAVGVAAVRYGAVGWEKRMRLSRFAAANQLVYSPSSPDPHYPGAIFGQGHSRTSIDHLRSSGDRFLDMGNYQYVTGSGKNSTTHNWGFMAFKLDRRLPHMVLDSTANNGWFGTNLPATFRKEQALSLEGDFNAHFTLYCPREYERDALYVFTPDLMALLIDEAAPFDVEIVDDWMFVYSSAKFDPLSPAVYQRLFRIVDTIGMKTLTQTDRYVDERVGTFAANVVAPQGQRLKKGLPAAAIVFIIVFGVIWVLPQVMAIFR